MGRTANSTAKPKRPVANWPTHPLELCRGVNDTWNSYQRANKGRTVTTSEWKSAQTLLWSEHDKLLASIALNSPISDAESRTSLEDNYEPQLSPGIKRELPSAANDLETYEEMDGRASPGLDSCEDNFAYPSDYFFKRPRISTDWDSGDYDSAEYLYDCDELSESYGIVSPEDHEW
jgi:hypothetical protein